ncbi:MAG: UDP-3-O-(3-hydroxymyristoyl)glucosamine N-acyltransferase [Pseudomonadota bacterium]|nr:MAG: UDP-3-O-(3-hydroxymyristoyl)glucosamine N-acyltransferase [Pseudomonadota bacterium]
MNKQAAGILHDFKARGILQDMSGPDATVTRIDPVDECTPDSLVFVDSDKFVDAALAAAPAAIVTRPDLAGSFSTLAKTAVLTAANVRLANALLRQAYDDRDFRATEWPRIHSSAVIHDTAQVADNALIGPGAVLGRDVNIGKGTVIMANTVIEEGASIGADSILHPNVVVGYNCELGDRVEVQSGCIIGMEGFGFAQDEERRSHRIPQRGKVVIEDDVVLGANCNIDRATYHETRISAGCKLDALCHIAHNVFLDRDCILTAHTVIAGSTRIGKRMLASGQTGILDHLTITDDVVLVQRAGVISDVTEPGVYAGLPLQPVKDYFRNTAVAQQLVELRKRLRGVEKELEALQKRA